MELLLAIKIISWIVLIGELGAFISGVQKMDNGFEVFILMIIVLLFMIPALYVIFGL
jgi:hypothetical protein